MKLAAIKRQRTELRRLEAAATPGPWDVVLERDQEHNPLIRVSSVGPLASDHDHWSGWTICDEPDARFIAAVRRSIVELLDALDAAEQKIKELEDQKVI